MVDRAHEDWLVLNRGVNGERTDQSPRAPRYEIRELDPDVLVIIAASRISIRDWVPRRSVRTQTMVRAGDNSRRSIPVVAASILPYNTASADANARMRKVNDGSEYAERHTQVPTATRERRRSTRRSGRLLSFLTLHPSPEGTG